MIVKDVTLPTPEENILLDEALFVLADKADGGEVLRFWESPQTFIVLGRIGKEHEEIDAAATCGDLIPVLRRSSGGGTVVQGPGCLNYTFVLLKSTDPALGDLRRSYQWISGKIIEALGRLGIQAVFHPISDIAHMSDQKKFSGNAQRRGRNVILHHGTILYNFDLSLISRYLKMPKDIPEYRRNRTHDEFVTNIPVEPADFKRNLAEICGVQCQESFLSHAQRAALDSLRLRSGLRVDLYPI